MSTESNTPAVVKPSAPILPKFQSIRDELKGTYFERNEIITGALVAFLSGKHMFVLGPAGTAKSAVINDICKRITDSTYFEWLLTRFTTPEELFGPLSLKALEQDRALRITKGKAPEAHVLFLDETFKANSAILNSLLKMMNERLFDNDGAPTKVPLVSAFGASNELPDSEELAPFYDRFLLRYVAQYLNGDGNFKQMMSSSAPSTYTTLSMDELKQAQDEVNLVAVPDSILDAIIEIRKRAKNEGIIASDRRYKQSLDVLKAHAWLNGRTSLSDDDTTMLAYILPDTPSQHTVIRKIVIEVANPVMSKVQELLDQAQEIEANRQSKIANADDDDVAKVKGDVGVECTTKFKAILESLDDIKTKLNKDGKDVSSIDTAVETVSKMQQQVLKDTFGL